ncbi:glycine cleavage system protein GcvH [Pseudazoarcus pumilus]|uniref:Glycine cleavage system H protein n=1 Tax=Pseudazoarcus pumilus TaxID=2067960 RepID=A0A2I6S6B1_9RHOO|nr:glycine cleavage system protein GcvH [Pseudazoarcus pumilus]AUN94796.1 glycine cleavage system protein H [Pseudazoarcus pumilus]
MSHLPAELAYAETHEWVRTEADGTLTIGITDHAQDALGDIVFVELPEAGRAIEAGAPCAVIESVKTASDIHAPVSGEIIAINNGVSEAPESVNDAPYDAWLFRMRPAAGAQPALLDAEAYRKLID